MMNPLTKEEAKLLKEYLDKKVEDFTMEEAERFLEIARKVVLEYGDRPEAYKLHIYATFVRASTWLRRRKAEKKEKR